MTFVDMDSIDFYQPRNKAGQSGDQRHTTSNNGVPIVDKERKTSTAFEPNDESSGRLQNYNLIESLDLTVPRLEVLDPFCELALTNAKGTSNGLNVTRGYDRNGSMLYHKVL